VVAEQGIALGYGRYSGDHTTYHHLLPGVRLIVLTEGKRGFETWIRERDSRMVDHVELREGRIQKIK
ncbi:MAG: serine/threonine protein phosphatase, partial [Alistipes sp.]